jgi:DNA processing protein
MAHEGAMPSFFYMYPSMSSDLLFTASVCAFPGLHARQRQRWLQAFPDAELAWQASRQELCGAGLSELMADRFLKWRLEHPPERLAEQCSQEGIAPIPLDDPAYPSLLMRISDPPPVLFARGMIPHGPALAVVGTRRVSPYGKSCVERLVPPLARAGLAIISGLALGIDSDVHRATLAAQGTTVAVLGSGVDEPSLYPRQHVTLAHDILAQGGAILSEVPPGTRPRPEHFPERNRLISGLSLATLVVEASEKSGSLITARCALEQDREVLAVPGPIWNAGSQGTHLLLKSGAHLCTDAQDVLDVLLLERPLQAQSAQQALPLTPEERRAHQLLLTARAPDELCRELQLTSPAMFALLTQLELKNIVKKLDGGQWIATR